MCFGCGFGVWFLVLIGCCCFFWYIMTYMITHLVKHNARWLTTIIKSKPRKTKKSLIDPHSDYFFSTKYN